MVTLTHIGLPQLQPQYQRMCSYVQSNEIVDQFSLVGIVTGWYKICVVNCPNGPFLPSGIGEIWQ